MNCERICELLYDYVNGELDGATAREVEEHIANCESCKKEYELLLGMSEAISDAAYVPPTELHEVIMSGIAAEKKRIRRSRLIKNLTAIGASAAAFVIVVNAIFGALDRAMDKGQNAPDSDESASIIMKSDNVFTSESESETMGETVKLSASTVGSFVGEWQTSLKNGRTVTMWIYGDHSVVVCVRERNGNETYYDGTLEFANGEITLSQSDGNKNFRACVDMVIDGGELFFDMVSGSTPWGEAT